MHLWWKCPNCGSKVDFTEELLGACFDAKDGEAYFDPEHGIIFHTIFCNVCGASWIMDIGNMSREFIKEKS